MDNTLSSPHAPCYPDLQGRVALVTGGGKGIGKGISLRLAAEGMHVCLCGRHEETLADTASLVRAAGGKALPIVTDLSKPEEIARLMETVAEEAGPLDLLVHNAAILRSKPLAQTSPEEWRYTIDTNLNSCYYLGRAALDVMVPRHQGSMVFVSTIGAQQAHHGLNAYDTSKGGVDSFVQSVAIELAPLGVRVNGIAPGAIRSRYHEAEVPVADLHHPHVPMERSGTPAEIAAAVAFLASSQASYITGHMLTVDGGATAQLSPRVAFL
jgi:NAD(P)-dependent dehydrogenase (short-subunit alcohol dehydrogenase family)